MVTSADRGQGKRHRQRNKNRGTGHDILDFCERELVALGEGGAEMKTAIIVLVKPRWNYCKTANFWRMLSREQVLSLTTFIEDDSVLFSSRHLRFSHKNGHSCVLILTRICLCGVILVTECHLEKQP